MPQLDTTTYIAQSVSILLSVGILLSLLWFGSYIIGYRHLHVDAVIAFSYLFVFHVKFSRRLIVLAGPVLQLHILVNAVYFPLVRKTLVYKF